VRGRYESHTWRSDPTLHAPRRYKQPCRYDAFIPRTLTKLPPLTAEVARDVSAAEEAIRQLNSVAQPGLQALARLLLRSESIASSKVEGMQADTRSLARAEARSDLGFTISPQQADVLANVDAMQLSMEEAASADRLTLDHLLATQQALLARAVNAERIAGVLREQQNWIGGNDYNPCGADFVPPPPKYVHPLLDDLVAFCNNHALLPLAQAAYAHAQFETIHPFVDGNGRTGRALVQVILRRRGLAPSYVPPISVALGADKAAYIAGLVAFREGQENEWIALFARAAARAAELASTYLVRVQQLQELWRERLGARGVRSDAAAWRVIDVLPGHPIISVPVAVSATGRAKAAVQQAVEHLVQAGVLEPLSSGKRNRQWEAIGLLELADDFEGLTVARAPSDLELMLRAKYAQALVSAYRDIVHLGEELLPELKAAADRRRGPADLRLKAERWIERSHLWAKDPNGPLNEKQRERFRYARLAPPPSYAELAEVVTANLDALDAVRDLIEADDRPPLSATAKATRERLDQLHIESDVDFAQSQRERRNLIRDGYALFPRFENPTERESTALARDARAWAYHAVAWVKADRPAAIAELPANEELRQADSAALERQLHALLAIVERG
jgi:Fic family protein